MLKLKDQRVLVFLTILIAIAYQLANTASIRVNGIQLFIYVLFFGFSLLFLLLDMVHSGIKVKKRYLFFFLSSFIYIFLIPIYINSNEFYWNYFSADLISFLMVFIFAYVAVYFGNYLDVKRLKMVLLFLVLAFFSGFLICSDCVKRYEPPHFLIFSIMFSLIYFYSLKMDYIRMVFFSVVYFSLLVINFASGERTGVVLALLLVVFYIWFKNKIAFLVFLIPAFLFVFSINFDMFDLGRFTTLFSEKGDQSLLSRLNEVYDVLNHFENNASFLNYLFGFGFSATYKPLFFSGVDLNVSQSGTVHHVHIFPFLVFLRFGILGVLLYVYLWWRVLKDLLVVSIRNNIHYNEIYIFTLLSMFLFLLDSLMRSVFVDPFFYIVLSLYLYFNANRKQKINFGD